MLIREPGSGTREVFDRTVGDGTSFLEDYREDGKKIDRNSVYAIVQTKGGSILSSVAADPQAIGYLSLGALNPSVKAIRVNGVYPAAESVLNGTYSLRRPFVICTARDVRPTSLCADFLRYLQSIRMIEHTQTSDCIRNASLGDSEFSPLDELPKGEVLLLRGSTSLEKLITAAAAGYAACYGADAARIFEIQLEGSSSGIKAALNDRTGRTIALSSAEVQNDRLNCFTVAYDALAVIVHPTNPIQTLTTTQLYAVFSGQIKHFDELEIDES